MRGQVAPDVPGEGGDDEEGEEEEVEGEGEGKGMLLGERAPGTLILRVLRCRR